MSRALGVDRGLEGALEELWLAVSLLRMAAVEIRDPAARHVFLQAVGRLSAVASEVAGLCEPVDV